MSFKTYVCGGPPRLYAHTLQHWALVHDMPARPGKPFEVWLNSMSELRESNRARALKLSRMLASSRGTMHGMLAAEPRRRRPNQRRYGIVGFLGGFTILAAGLLLGVIRGDPIMRGNRLAVVEDSHDDALRAVLREAGVDVVEEGVDDTIEARVQLEQALDAYEEDREMRMPAKNIGDAYSKNKLFHHMAGWLTDDKRQLEQEIVRVQDLIAQIRDLVIPSGKSIKKSRIKRAYVEGPILRPIVKNLTLQALKADHAFVESSYAVALGDDRQTATQTQRATTILQDIYSGIGQTVAPGVIRQQVAGILRDVGHRPDLWYRHDLTTDMTKVKIVKFLREQTSAYLLDSIDRFSSRDVTSAEYEQDIHALAVIDTALDGDGIRLDLERQKARDPVDVNAEDAMGKIIVDRYTKFIEESPVPDDVKDKLIGRLRRRLKHQVVEHVNALMEIYDEDLVQTFNRRQLNAQARRTDNLLGRILNPLKETLAHERGKYEGSASVLRDVEKTLWNYSLMLMATLAGLSALAITAKFGCPSCRRGETASVPVRTHRSPSKGRAPPEPVKNSPVYAFRPGGPLYIFENGRYVRISDRGRNIHYYYRLKSGSIGSKQVQAKIERGDPNVSDIRRVGETDEHGHYIPHISHD